MGNLSTRAVCGRGACLDVLLEELDLEGVDARVAQKKLPVEAQRVPAHPAPRGISMLIIAGGKRRVGSLQGILGKVGWGEGGKRTRGSDRAR